MQPIQYSELHTDKEQTRRNRGKKLKYDKNPHQTQNINH